MSSSSSARSTAASLPQTSRSSSHSRFSKNLVRALLAGRGSMPPVTRLVLAAGAAALAFAGAAQAADVSSNWSGYAVTGADATTGAQTQFTTVTATWIQPRATCTHRAGTFSAFWVGLG